MRVLFTLCNNINRKLRRQHTPQERNWLPLSVNLKAYCKTCDKVITEVGRPHHRRNFPALSEQLTINLK